MMKKTHIVVGVAATLPFININNILFLPIAILGSFIPDWDYKLGLKHRGITHTMLALLVTSLVLSLCSIKLGLLWSLNYGTHLLLDSLTVTGIPILYPIRNKYYGFKLFKTRGAEDGLIFLICFYIVMFLFWE